MIWAVDKSQLVRQGDDTELKIHPEISDRF